eukprot:g639.t1
MVPTWKLRFFVLDLRSRQLRYGASQADAEYAAIGICTVHGASSVVDRPGKRQHRIDIDAQSQSKGRYTLSIAADTLEAKRRWLTALCRSGDRAGASDGGADAKVPRSVVAAGRGARKCRILAFHGAGTTPEVFEWQSEQLRRALGARGVQVDFVFLRAPHEAPAAHAMFESMFRGPFAAWWPEDLERAGASSDDVVAAAAISLASAARALHQQGPFDALLGFSQGATTIAALTALAHAVQQGGAAGAAAASHPQLGAAAAQLANLRPWPLCVLVCGKAISGDRWGRWLDDVAGMPSRSVHVLSPTDAVYSSGLELLGRFKARTAPGSCTLLEHGEGHALPAADAQVTKIEAAEACAQSMVCTASEFTDISSTGYALSLIGGTCLVLTSLVFPQLRRTLFTQCVIMLAVTDMLWVSCFLVVACTHTCFLWLAAGYFTTCSQLWVCVLGLVWLVEGARAAGRVVGTEGADGTVGASRSCGALKLRWLALFVYGTPWLVFGPVEYYADDFEWRGYTLQCQPRARAVFGQHYQNVFIFTCSALLTLLWSVFVLVFQLSGAWGSRGEGREALLAGEAPRPRHDPALKARGRYLAVYIVCWAPFITWEYIRVAGAADPRDLLLTQVFTFGVQGFLNSVVFGTMPPDFFYQRFAIRILRTVREQMERQGRRGDGRAGGRGRDSNMAGSLLEMHGMLEAECTMSARAVSMGRLLGRGATAAVYQGSLRAPAGAGVGVSKPSKTQQPQVVAVKEFFSTARDDAETYLREKRILQRCAHVNVVRFIGCCVGPRMRFRIVMESCVNSLDHLCYKNNAAGGADGPARVLDAEATKLRFAHEIALGMQCIHELGIVHFDLKPANVLLDAKLTCKIADFGLARF